MARKRNARGTRGTTERRGRRQAEPQPSPDARTLDARPDTLDFRDLMFTPTLIEVPTEHPLPEYRKWNVPILNQGTEGACTGFGLATVIHYLLRSRRVVPDRDEVSPRMLYEMARRYDEWPGEDYSGSSARGAMKGWHKHGVCSSKHWAYLTSDTQDAKLFSARYENALRRPLGAYFRVNHRDIVSMHGALAEVGIMYATGQVHDGWGSIGANGLIDWNASRTIQGGHAFAIVAYDERGFWIQNSWGNKWGKDGYAQITYDDWLANGTDAWVARLGAPIVLQERESVSRGVGVAAQGTRSYVFCDLRPHIISLGNDGALKPNGTYGTSESDVREIFNHIKGQVQRPKGPKRLLLYAHGGLTAEDSAIQKVADLRGPLLDAGIYPISLIWHTDFWTTLRNILQDAVTKRRPEGFLDSAKDFMLDRLDDALEPLARTLGGKSVWSEMKENAVMASDAGGGLRVVLGEIETLVAANPALEIHLVGHSAGSILLGGLVKAMTASSLNVETCTLWAPACTIDFYREHYLPAIEGARINHFAVFAMTDQAEQDDNCANIYHKSLLYLVSHAFEKYLRQPGLLKHAAASRRPGGEPLLGMVKWVKAELTAEERNWDLVLAPNDVTEGDRGASRASAHGAFDDDEATLKATFARILDDKSVGQVSFGAGKLHSEARNRARRAALSAASNARMF